MFGSLDKSSRTTKYWGMFVSRFGKWPTRDEYLAFVWRRLVTYGSTPHAVLPISVAEAYETERLTHADVMATLTPAEFAARWAASLALDKRRRMEAEYLAAGGKRGGGGGGGSGPGAGGEGRGPEGAPGV